MGEIQFTGLSTGLDTAAIVKALMAIESRRLEAHEAKKIGQEEIRDALSELGGKIDTLQEAVKDLSDSSKLRSYSTTSSDEDVLTFEAMANAYEGNHSVEINQLANAERWVHNTGVEYVEDYVGAGTFIYSYNNQEAIITTTAQTTLDDLVGLINNDADNPGVTASLLYYNNAYHLVLNGNDAGSDYEISINATNTEAWQADSAFTDGSDNATSSTLFTGLDQFSGELVGDESITISGTQHDGTAVNETFSINGNMKLSHLVDEINDVFGDTAKATLVNGQIVLTDTTSGTSQMTLSLTYNAGSGTSALTMPSISQRTEGGTVSASLAGFAAADFTETLSAQDSQIKVDGYPTGAGEWISRSSNTISDVISGVTLHLHDTGTVQVSLTRDVESLKTRVDDFINAYNDVKTFLVENTAYSEDEEEAGLLQTDSTVRSIGNMLRIPLIQRTYGFLMDIDSFLMPAQIGLELDRDGVLTLDRSAFDDAVAEDYMGVLDLIGADKTGSSNSNTVQFYGASSKYTRGGTYDVQVVISGGVITSAQIKAESDASYREATIDGNIITGDSSFTEDGYVVYPENGLQLSVDLTQDGTFAAKVYVKQGFAGTMEDVIDQIMKSTNGALKLDQDSVEDRIRRLKEAIEDEELRLAAKEQRLVVHYARLEKTLTLLQNQGAALRM